MAGPVPLTGHMTGLEVATPLKATTWRQELASYPNQAFAAFLFRGIFEGFRIGVLLQVAWSWRMSKLVRAHAHEAIVKDYLDREVLFRCMQRLSPSEELSLIPLGFQK